jgi:subtilisin family serine protease
MAFRPIRFEARLGAATILVGAALLTACGGGGGTPSTPPPPTVQTPSAPPAPPPPVTPPTPPAAINYNTAEYQRSGGATHMNAIAAYNKGATGAGVTVAVLDSGIDTENPEFAGRIHAASQDVVGGRGIDDASGHGTSVSGVLLAAKNDSGMHGAAFGSTLLTLRTDDPGSCTDDKGCQHNDNSLARAVDIAVANGARVVNMSLGGSGANQTLRSAIARATRSGVIVVISAGNDASANPDALAMVAADPTTANGLVVIAGSVGTATDAQALSDFSNRAGTGANVYLAALGYRVRSYDENGVQFLYSGTSYAAPNVAAAAALLISAFPNLTAAQVIDILYRSATDAGVTGVDADYGRGILDLTRAFQPQGATSLPGSAVPVATTSNASLGGAFGDGGKVGSSLEGAVILDGYGRAFAMDLGRTIAATPAQRPLGQRLADRSRGVSGGTDDRYFYLNVSPATSTRPWVGLAQMGVDHGAADRMRARHGLISSKLDAKTRMGVAVGYGAETLLGSLGVGRPDGAFITGADPLTDAGFGRRGATSAALTRQLGRWSLGLAAGHARTDHRQSTPGLRRSGAVDTVAVEAARAIGPVDLNLGLGHMRESDTVLGSWTGPALGFEGATTRFASAEARMALGSGVSIGAGARHGWTEARLGNGLIAGIDGIRSFGFQFDLSKQGLAGASDRIDLRVAQPLRVVGGTARLSVPVAYDYATLGAAMETRSASLVPSGRELDLEAAYSIGVLGGEFGAHLYWRNQPGHVATRADDLGAAVRFSLGF